jgi:two-component system NtrC family sensor kinase
MKIAQKMIAAVAAIVLLGMSIYAELKVSREVSLFESDMSRDHLILGRALAPAAAAMANQEGDERAAEMVRQSSQAEKDGELSLRLIWLDASAGDDRTAGPSAKDAEALRQGEAVETPSSDEARLITWVPMRTRAGRLGAIEISESLGEQARYVRITVIRSVVSALALAAGCAIAVAWMGLRFIGRPLAMLVSQARTVGTGDFSVRLHFAQKDELGDLSHEMNAMCEKLAQAHQRIITETARRIATLEQLRHADRLTTVGKLAAGVAHELGTPLNVVHGRAKLISGDAAVPGDAAQSARIIAEQAERMTKIIRQLLDFARRKGPNKERADVCELIERTIALLGPMAEKKRVAVRVSPPEVRTTADVDAGAMQQVITNLLVNAIQAMPNGGKVTVTLRTEHLAPPDGGGEQGDFLAVRIEDQGEGIPPDVLEHIFEPFFTTKDVGEGTGLGLSVSYGIVQDHGGFISVDSKVGQGSAFSVHLPIGPA